MKRWDTHVALVCAGLLTAASGSVAAETWTQLDRIVDSRDTHKFMLREADSASLLRTGPWVTFGQRWLQYEDTHRIADPIFETMAVNCATGARGVIEYQQSEPSPDTQRTVRLTTIEIERTQYPLTRLNIDKPLDSLDTALVHFACDCPKATERGRKPTTAELKALYDQYVAEQRQVREYRLSVIRVATFDEARSIVSQLDAGTSFASLADQLSLLKDEFPHGDMGVHKEDSWTPRFARVLRGLKEGEYTRTPVMDEANNFAIYRVETVRELPPPKIEEVRSALAMYAQRARECAWDEPALSK
jgi:hypothetical protein